MPLLGKIVVIKRNGGDGTEFPLTASCLFGRKLDCDIRIQLPQVSKEHCKIELNENKELILTNLSSVNPTRINGEVFNQSERLKHGDLITIIDRSFRFEYPPPKTPKKKRLSEVGKDITVQVLQDQQEKSTPVPVEKRNSVDTCLKDGSNLPPSVEQIIEAESEDGKLKKGSMSPFGELYQMVKQDLVTKSPWKPELPKTPLAKPQVDHEEVPAADVKSTLKQVTTPSTKKRRSSKSNSEDMDKPATPQSSLKANLEEKHDDISSLGSSTPSLTEKSVTPVSQKKKTPSKTPQKFSAGEVVQQILSEPQPEQKTPKSPKGRRSGGSNDHSLVSPVPSGQTPGSNSKIKEVKMSPRTSPRSNAGKRFQIQDEVKNTPSASKKKADTSGNASQTKAKKKRVSFGGQLSPELFDKRLPPNSPLRRGATPRHSLGPSLKSQSLLRRASTIGLLALRLEETVPEAKKSSPKKASPKRTTSAAKIPSPAKRSPSPKAKTPSPKRQKSPSAPTKASTPSPTSATPKTPASTRRASTSSIEAAGDTLPETPRVQGRFSVSRISTPSPDQEQKSEVESSIVEDVSQKCVTPKIPLRRKSMKSSAKKTPKSAIKSALNVMRSRRSGASRANLKVLSSWADIVKFGQTKPQTEVATKKKPAKSSVVKRTVVPKPKTPARRLKDDISTGHAASPVSIVVGRAHMRTNQFVGAAPKIVPNIVLSKKDMKMDEDLTGVADIFKTPANSKSKSTVLTNNECPEATLDEMSVMKTPEESGEMIVSPLSVVSTAKRGRYSNDAVTRLLLDKQDGSLLENKSPAQLADESNEASGHDVIQDQETLPIDQTEEDESAPEIVETPKQKAAPSLCLTGVKRLMKTPKQRSEPIEDLRGKLLKTPKDCKPPQEESLEGVKELLKTPKYRGAPVEDVLGVKRVMQTPKEKSNPVLCAVGIRRLMKTPKEKSEECEDFTGVEELMKTPQMKGDLVENQCDVKEVKKTPKRKRNEVEEDLTGIQQLMKTPKHRGEPVEDQMGVKRLMQTPKEKFEPVEDLTGVKQLMQTPKQKGEPVTNKFGISKLMKTPRVKGVMAEEDFTGLKELVEPENNSTSESNVTEPVEVQETVLAEETGSTVMPAEDLEECDKENVCPVETMETEVLKSEHLQCTAQAVESNHSDPETTETVILQEDHPDQIDEQSVTVEAIDDCSSGKEEESVCTSDNTNTVEATPASSTVEEEEGELIKPSVANKIQRGGRGRAAQKCKNGNNEMAEAPSVLTSTEEEHMSDPLPSGPARGRRVKKLLEVAEVAASPVRKSARGRIPKRVVDEETKKTGASQLQVDPVKMDVTDCLPVVTKTRKGRKAKQDNADAAAEPIPDVNASDSQCSDVSSNEEVVQAPVVKSGRRKKINEMERLDVVEPIPDVNAVESECPDAPENGEKVQAPVVKSGKRKKMDKTESQPSEEPEQKTAVSEDNAVVAEVAELQTSQVTESVSSTRTRRGRLTKKTEQTQVLESSITSTPAVAVVEQPLTSLAKSGRGRKAKEETVKDQPSDDVVIDVQTAPEVNVDHKEPQLPVVKSGRGRKARQQKPQTAEEVIEQLTVDTETHVPVTEETVVKSVRGSRNAKQSKVTVEAEQNIVIPVEQTETPVAKSSRRRANIAKETKTEPEVSVRRGRRAVADPAPPVAVVSSRGRKAVVSSESEVTKDVASEEPVKPVKNTRRTAKAPESKKIAVTQADSEVVATETTAAVAVEKVERGSRGKRQKDSTKAIPSSPVKESTATEEASEVKPSKSVNWDPNLVAEKDIEEPSADVEPPLKKPKRLGKVQAETSSTESSQPRGRRGRAAAKKEEELPVENSQEETQVEVKPLRRGKAVASSAPKPSDIKASTPLKRKRNEVLVDSDESINMKPLPKRRGRVANGDETAEEVSSKEKIPEAAPEKVEATPKKSVGRAGRGQKKAAQEPEPAPAQESISGTATRKGRGVKKVEEVEAAPVRRTRRK